MDDWLSRQNSSKRNHEHTWSRDDGPSRQNSSRRNHEHTRSRDDGPSRQNFSRRNHEHTRSRDDGLSRQNFSRRNHDHTRSTDSGRLKSRQNFLKSMHKQTLKQLEGNIRRLSCDVNNLYHDVSSFSNTCNQRKLSSRKLYESMVNVTHHIENLSIDESKLTRNSRALTRNVYMNDKMVSFKTELDGEDDNGKCKSTLLLHSRPKERRKFLSKFDKFSKELSESPIFCADLPVPNVDKNRKSLDFFIKKTLPQMPNMPMALKPARSLCCSTTKKDFDLCKARSDFGCKRNEDPFSSSKYLRGVTKVDRLPPFNRFVNFIPKKVDYDRCAVKADIGHTRKPAPSFSGFVRRNQCENIESKPCGTVKKMPVKKNTVRTSNSRPAPEEQCPDQLHQRPLPASELIDEHISCLNKKTMLMSINRLEKNYDYDLKHSNPLANKLISAIMASQSCQSLKNQKSSTNCPSECSPKSTPLESSPKCLPECSPTSTPLECSESTSSEDCPKSTPLESSPKCLPECSPKSTPLECSESTSSEDSPKATPFILRTIVCKSALSENSSKSTSSESSNESPPKSLPTKCSPRLFLRTTSKCSHKAILQEFSNKDSSVDPPTKSPPKSILKKCSHKAEVSHKPSSENLPPKFPPKHTPSKCSHKSSRLSHKCSSEDLLPKHSPSECSHRSILPKVFHKRSAENISPKSPPKHTPSKCSHKSNRLSHKCSSEDLLPKHSPSKCSHRSSRLEVLYKSSSENISTEPPPKHTPSECSHKSSSQEVVRESSSENLSTELPPKHALSKSSNKTTPQKFSHKRSTENLPEKSPSQSRTKNPIKCITSEEEEEEESDVSVSVSVSNEKVSNLKRSRQSNEKSNRSILKSNKSNVKKKHSGRKLSVEIQRSDNRKKLAKKDKNCSDTSDSEWLPKHRKNSSISTKLPYKGILKNTPTQFKTSIIFDDPGMGLDGDSGSELVVSVSDDGSVEFSASRTNVRPKFRKPPRAKHSRSYTASSVDCPSQNSLSRVYRTASSTDVPSQISLSSSRPSVFRDHYHRGHMSKKMLNYIRSNSGGPCHSCVSTDAEESVYSSFF